VGGIEAWRAARGELEAGEAERNRKAGLVSKTADQYVEGAEVSEAFVREDFEIIDLRGRDVWMCYDEIGNLRAGHIPHSIPSNLSRSWICEGNSISIVDIYPRPSACPFICFGIEAALRGGAVPICLCTSRTR